MKKSIFSASFEESLNLLDDASLQYIKKDYYEKLGKGLNNGKPSIGFRIKSILNYSLFVVLFGYHSFLLENLCENHFFDHTDIAFISRPFCFGSFLNSISWP